MPRRYVSDPKKGQVVDTQTGETITFENDDGTLTMLATFLYNSMNTMTTENKETNEIRNSSDGRNVLGS